MKLAILWSEQAQTDYWANIEYLERERSSSEINKFIAKVDSLIGLLSIGLIQFKPTLFRNTFHVVVIKQITLYYKIDHDVITLLRFWNTYQDPSKLLLD